MAENDRNSEFEKIFTIVHFVKITISLLSVKLVTLLAAANQNAAFQRGITKLLSKLFMALAPVLPQLLAQILNIILLLTNLLSKNNTGSNVP